MAVVSSPQSQRHTATRRPLLSFPTFDDFEALNPQATVTISPPTPLADSLSGRVWGNRTHCQDGHNRAVQIAIERGVGQVDGRSDPVLD